METKTRRNDLIDLMIDALKSDRGDSDGPIEIDELLVVANAVVVLVAGFETTSSTIGFVCWEMALNPNVQKRLQAEIDEAIAKCESGDGKLSYQEVNDLEYLDSVVHESLRLHTPPALTSRRCTADYTLPGTDVTFKVGDEVQIPIRGIHMDERNYPKPEQFRPDRFSKAAREARHPMTWQAFGSGPRMCIGSRFALFEAKVGLIEILRKFSLLKGSKTPTKVEWDRNTFLGNSKHPLLVMPKRRYNK